MQQLFDRPAFSSVTGIEKLARTGALILFLFFGVFGAWAATAPLSGAVIALGEIVNEGKSKEVSHEIGGVVAEIHVEEGQRVNAGDVLVVLDDVDRRSDRNSLRAQLFTLWVTQARLQAEQSGKEDFVLEDVTDLFGTSINDITSLEFRAAFQDQQREFRSRRSKRMNDIAVLQAERQVLDSELRGINRQISSANRTVDSYSQEVVTLRNLMNEGFTSAAEFRMVERELAEARESLERLTTTSKTIPTQIALLEERIAQAESDFLAQLSRELAENRQKLVDVRNRLDSADKAFERVDIVAPVAGVVDELHYNTIGSAVPAFRPIVEMMPEDDTLIMEVRVAPTDIELVQIDQYAQVVLSAYDRDEVLPVSARTVFISPYKRVDEQTGESFFTARLQLDSDQMQGLPRLTPGMPVEAYLKTTERTLLEILFEPFTKSMDRSFRS